MSEKKGSILGKMLAVLAALFVACFLGIVLLLVLFTEEEIIDGFVEILAYAEGMEVEEYRAKLEADASPTLPYLNYQIPKREYRTKIGKNNYQLLHDDGRVVVQSYRMSSKNSFGKTKIKKGMLPDDCHRLNTTIIIDADMDGKVDSCAKCDFLECMKDYQDWEKPFCKELKLQACQKRFIKILGDVVSDYHENDGSNVVDVAPPGDNYQFPVRSKDGEDSMCKNIHLKASLTRWRNQSFKKFVAKEAKALQENGATPNASGLLSEGVKVSERTGAYCGGTATFKMIIVKGRGQRVHAQKCTAEYDFDPVENTWSRSGELDCKIDDTAEMKEDLRQFFKLLKEVW